MIISHTSKSFEYALSYLRWLKNNKLDLNDYISRHKLLKDALNKSYKRTNSNKFIRKPPFIKKTSSFKRIISEPSIPKKNKEKKVVKKNNHPKSTYRCASCNSLIELGRIKAVPTTAMCKLRRKDPNNKKIDTLEIPLEAERIIKEIGVVGEGKNFIKAKLTNKDNIRRLQAR